MGRTVDVVWLRRAAPWLKRTGFVGDMLAFPLSGWEQWEQDAGRAELPTPSGGCELE